MWAQLVKVRIPSAKEDEANRFHERWEQEVGRGTDAGWVRTQVFRTEKDPDAHYILVTFESEEKARSSEQSPQHQAVMEQFMTLIEGEPEFVDLRPIREGTK